MMDELVSVTFIKRIQSRLKNIDFEELGVTHFYFAGNALNVGLPNDLDLFPVEKNDFKRQWEATGVKVTSTTPNATTIKASGQTLQLCNYWYPSLKELVESFDFAHIKIGAEVTVEGSIVSVGDIYMSPDFVIAKTTGKTFFTGSKFPLSSLIRLFKYHKRGDHVIGHQYIFEAINILSAIIARGFTDYNDYKNQLDAVDLGLLPEEMEEFKNKQSSLWKLFDLLEKKK
jgi:hypothetical protein